VLPLIFLVMGGIGLPGGAVYIERWRLRGPVWESAVSLAGPVANAFLALMLGLVLRLAPVSSEGIWPALSFLALLQVSAVVLNLIPLPPFDGFGVVEPFLPGTIRMRLAETRGMLSWVVFLVLWYVPAVFNAFWDLVGILARLAGVPLDLAGLGLDQFLFWR
jgi:Zn-dependent protease